jgi:hypothetical protein
MDRPRKKTTYRFAFVCACFVLTGNSLSAYIPKPETLLKNAISKMNVSNSVQLVYTVKANPKSANANPYVGEETIRLDKHGNVSFSFARGWQYCLRENSIQIQKQEQEPVQTKPLSILYFLELMLSMRSEKAFVQVLKGLLVSPEITTFTRLAGGGFAVILGAKERNPNLPQIWFHKTDQVPVRISAANEDVSLRMELSDYQAIRGVGNIPRKVELFIDQTLREERLFKKSQSLAEHPSCEKGANAPKPHDLEQMLYIATNDFLERYRFDL